MKIDFKNFKMFRDIARTQPVVIDATADFANLIYTNTNGIVAHALAMKIYNSTGPVEVNEEEQDIIVRFAESNCSPAFIDGIREQLNP